MRLFDVSHFDVFHFTFVAHLDITHTHFLPAVNFINILGTIFLYKYDVLAAFPNYMYVEKATKMTFVQKTRAYNVYEIDTYSQFH